MLPPGHFYSPEIDRDELRRRADRVWSPHSVPPPGIDFREAVQRQTLASFGPLAHEFDYGSAPSATASFFEPNGKFEGMDSRSLFCFLRTSRPRRLIEVGAGYSSLLIADVKHRFLGDQLHVTSIDPEPPSFVEAMPAIDRLIRAPVQDVDVGIFAALEHGDVLFIDSSHVSKTGSDVNLLYLEILPRLAEGVLIHSHDIFFPHEYPLEWVLDEGRSWNEQYLLQALLVGSVLFEVVLGCAWAHRYFPELVAATFGKVVSGGSLWYRKRA